MRHRKGTVNGGPVRSDLIGVIMRSVAFVGGLVPRKRDALRQTENAGPEHVGVAGPDAARVQIEALTRHIAGLKTALTIAEQDLDRLRGQAGMSPSDVSAASDEDVALVAQAAPFFDAAWYLSHHGLPADTDAPRHYLVEGARLGLDPGPAFAAAWYLDQNEDARAAGLNPLLHYLRHGRSEARPTAPPVVLDDPSLLRADDLFDAEWYARQNPGVAETDLAPVDHYLGIGAPAGRDPGPGFSTRAYLDKHQDVRRSGLNPLVHYLRHGRAENRAIEPSGEFVITPAGIAAVRKSSLFDADWYLARYDDVRAAGRDPAIDYLAEGATAGRDPGPGFSTAWYFRTYPDVAAATHLNPLLHYLRHGKGEGRAPRLVPPAFEDVLRPASAARLRRVARAALRGTTDLVTDDEGWSDATEACEGAATILLGASLGHTRSKDAEFEGVLDGLLHLHGLAVAGGPRLGLPETLRGLGVTIGNLWFVNDNAIRLRIDPGLNGRFAERLRLRFFQIEADRLVACGDADIAGDGPRIIDVAPRNAFLPLLIVSTDAAEVIVGMTLAPFPTLFHGGAHQAEASPEGGAQGGFAAACRLSDDLLAGWRDERGCPLIASISLDGTGATGAEWIFSWPVREWLAAVAGVAVAWEKPGPPGVWLPEALGSATAAADRARDGALRLVLSTDSLPAIGALFARGAAHVPEEGVAASFLTVDPISAEPRFAIEIPPRCGVGLLPLQPVNAPLPFPYLLPAAASRADAMIEADHALGRPLALRFHTPTADPSQLVYPRAVEAPGPLLPVVPAAARVTVIVPAVTHSDTVSVLLASLARQRSAATLDVLLVAATADEHAALAERAFPGRWHILGAVEDGDRLADATAMATGDYLLFLDEGTVLHDPRTLETLLALAAAPQVASASCLQIHEASGRQTATRPGSGGFFPSAETADGAVFLTDTGSFGALPQATYPTAGHGPGCLLVPAALWRTVEVAEGSLAQRTLRYCAQALAQGYRHLATSAVTVTTPAGPETDTGAAPMPVNWATIAGTAPLLREIGA